MTTTTSLSACPNCGSPLTDAATCPACASAEPVSDRPTAAKLICIDAICLAGVLALSLGVAWLVASPSPGARSASSSPAASAPSRRHYVDADFYWDTETKPHRERLVDLVDAAWPKVPGCRDIDPGTLSYSPTRTSAFGKGPTFFVTCTNPNGVPFNYWFTLDGEILDWQKPR